MPDTARRMRVMLVDDEPTSSATLVDFLDEAELEARIASSFEEATSILDGDQRRWLVLLNAHTEPTAGMRFMHALDGAAAPRARCTVVDIARAMGNGDVLPARSADRVIERPLNPRELLEIVRGYLDAPA